MAIGRWFRALLAIAVVGLAGAGCFSPNYPNGAVPCGAAGECPDGFRCEFDRMCYQTGGGVCPPGTVPLDGGGCSDRVKVLAMADDHACAVYRDGSLWCWGESAYGQLGTGIGAEDTNAPVRVGAEQWSTVSVGSWYSCGIKADATLWCWGDNGCGAVGTTMPEQQGCNAFLPVFDAFNTGGTRKFLDVIAGPSTACAIDAEHALWCWGANRSGQAGVNSTAPVEVATRVGSDSPADKDWGSVVVGDGYTCGLRSGGALWCWGANDVGQLGDAAAEPMALAPKRIGDVTLAAVSLGGSHTCGVTASKQLLCWGEGSNGELGNGMSGSGVQQTTPLAIGAGRQWVEVKAGVIHTCARDDGGRVFCFGHNSDGELGDGSFIARPVPTAAGTATDWAGLVVGVDNVTTCGKKTDGHIACWGLNARGIFGTGRGGPAPRPRETMNGAVWKQVGVGLEHGCGLKVDGSLWCWGTRGTLGIGVDLASLDMDAPMPVMAGVAWRTLAVGASHACAIAVDGALYCWGANFNGQVGIGTTSGAEASPRRVNAPDTFTAVSAGASTSCAIRSDGTLWCWGANESGEIGNGAPGGNVTMPYNLGGDWDRVAAGTSTTCAITGGVLYCWGADGNGQVGIAPPASGAPVYATPQRVDNTTEWTDVAVGDSHTCGMKFGGRLVCFGANANGQLGTGGTSRGVTLPVLVGTGYQAVAASPANTCAITTDGTLQCWGQAGLISGNGAHATGKEPPVLVPTAISARHDWASLSLSGLTACARHTDNSYACWGSDNSGAMGDDATFYENPTPVD
jgi:alpha-tubulin suppressor-like RCC1 family protein